MQPWRRLLLLLVVVALIGVVSCQEEPKTGAVQPEATEEAEETAEAVEAAADAAEEEAEVAEDETPVEAAAPAEEEADVDESSQREARAGSASVQWVVTQKMQAQLSKLGYTADEIAKLEPERAAAIIRRSISRPHKGVPTGWNKGPGRTARPALGRSLLAAVQKVPGGPAVPLVGLAAVATLVSVGLGPLSLGGAAVVERALAPVEAEEVVVESSGDSELWLDRQIDKLILFLKGLLGK